MKFELFVTTAVVLMAAGGVAGTDPCKPDTRDLSVCGGSGAVCTDDSQCCNGLGCFGYNFFKKCQPPPVCLPEFHDCSSGMLCCGTLVCSETKGGKAECQKEKIGTIPVFLPGKSNLVETEAPTAAPKATNTKTTKIPGKKVVTNVACLTGDPHIVTFDGLAYDCQTHGEHIIAKSPITQRQIQGRFSQVEKHAASVITGFVMQDEGATPKVQISMPLVDEGISHVMGPDKCKVQLFVDGVQRDLMKGSGTDAVSVTVVDNSTISIKYKVSEMKAQVTMGWWNGCLLNTCFYIPNTDPVVGLVGSADKNANNDWFTRTGSLITVPTDKNIRNRQPAYDYCAKNWCMRDPKESLFTYNQLGLDFEDFNRCDLKYGKILDEDLADLLTPAIQTGCGDDLECLIDAVNGDLAGAKQAQKARMALKETCNGDGGECGISACCTGFFCEDQGIAGKKCVKQKSGCAPSLGNCASATCCEGLQCVETAGGLKMCQEIPSVCVAEAFSCKSSDECCDSMACIGAEGDKRCKKITKLKNTVCLPKNEACGFGIDCCPGSQCVDDFTSGHRCLSLPACWDTAMRPCDDIEGLPKCCDGFECVERKGRNVCSPLPECSTKWLSCDKVPCCESDGTYPLECVAATTDGVTRKMCQPKRPDPAAGAS